MVFLSPKNKGKVTHVWDLMAVERDWLKSFADQERSLLTVVASKWLFGDVGSVLAVLDEIEAFLGFEFDLFADQNDRLFCLAGRIVIYSLS